MTIPFREARAEDLPRLVEMLADDTLGATRERFEDPLPAEYRAAFEAIAADPNQQLLVAERAGDVVGTLQLTFIPSITRLGAWRSQIEGVRVASEARGEGLGRALVEEALRRSRERGVKLVQLTTDKQRPDALRFYEDLGFTSTHEGLKLHLEAIQPKQ